MNSRSRYRHFSVRTSDLPATFTPTEAAAAHKFHNPKGPGLANATARIAGTEELADQEERGVGERAEKATKGEVGGYTTNRARVAAKKAQRGVGEEAERSNLFPRSEELAPSPTKPAPKKSLVTHQRFA